MYPYGSGVKKQQNGSGQFSYNRYEDSRDVFRPGVPRAIPSFQSQPEPTNTNFQQNRFLTSVPSGDYAANSFHGVMGTLQQNVMGPRPTNTGFQQNRFLTTDSRFSTQESGVPSTSFAANSYQRESGTLQQNIIPPISQDFISHQSIRMINAEVTKFQQTNIKTGKDFPEIINNPGILPKKPFKLMLPETSGKVKKDIKQESAKPNFNNKTHHFTGSVEQVIRWYQSLKHANVNAVYEVHGILESTYARPDKTTVLMIKQTDGHNSIQGVFYCIDRPFTVSLKIGDNIVCLGMMKGAKKMQVYNALKDEGQQVDYKRISFLCQRAIQEMLVSPEP